MNLTDAEFANLAVSALREFEGRAWPGGPVVDPYIWRTPAGERVGPELKSLLVELPTVCGWISEVEQALGDRARAAQCIRRLWYSGPMRNGRFDRAIQTDLSARVTNAQVSQATVDGLARCGLVQVHPYSSPDGVVDLSHVFVLLDYVLNHDGPTSSQLKWRLALGPGADASVPAMLSWLGDLASIWTGFQTLRARWMEKNKEKAPTRGLPTTPDSEAYWLEKGFAERSPMSDLLGDLDAVVLSHELVQSADVSLADLIHDYYAEAWTGVQSSGISVVDRFRLFLERSDPKIPSTGTGSATTLAAGAPEEIKTQIEDSCKLLLEAARVERGSYWGALIAGGEVAEPWGSWAVSEIAKRFEALLRAGLSGTSLSNAWPATLPDPVNVGYPAVFNGAAAEALVSGDPNALALDTLQALTQYHLTVNDPWGPAGGAGPLVSAAWLRDPSGTRARSGTDTTSRGPAVVIEDKVDLREIWPALTTSSPHRDLIHLEGARSGRASKIFRIEGVDPSTRTLFLDQNPGLSEQSAWQVIRRPRLVLVDPFGFRPHLVGNAATVLTRSDASTPDLQLDGDASTVRALKGVNLGLDTILLDDEENVPRLPFRIVSIDLSDPAKPTLVLDRRPTLSMPGRWQIPAGVRGGESPLADSVPPKPGAGADHYDGVMFMVYRGAIVQALPWTSYTSFAPDATGKATRTRSLRGNRRYDVLAYRSPEGATEKATRGARFRNHCFMVHEVSERQKVLMQQSDSTSGREYFLDVGTYPFPGAKPLTPKDASEQQIRVHYGNKVPPNGVLSTGSAGCLVSPQFFTLRSALIETYQNELATLELPQDKVLADLAEAQDLTAAKAQYDKVPSAQWDGIVVAELFVVRPDERPLAAAPALTRWVD